MGERIERNDIENLLNEIKIRLDSENEVLEIIEKHPIAVLLAAFGAGVILSQIDDYLIEKVETGKINPAINGIMKVGLPVIMKKFIR